MDQTIFNQGKPWVPTLAITILITIIFGGAIDPVPFGGSRSTGETDASFERSAKLSDSTVLVKYQDQEEEGVAQGALPAASDLVADWDEPVVTLFFSGSQQGYIEPCGCTGLENQYGGMLRRHSALRVLQERGWNLIKLDSGDQVKRFGQQPLIKMRRTFEALAGVMDYDVIGLGKGDLKIPSIDLAQTMIKMPMQNYPFVCANVEVVDPAVCQKYKVLERNGKRIGVTMILGEEYFEELSRTDGITLRPVRATLQEVIPQLKGERCDATILVVAASTEQCRLLAQEFPDFDLLITTDCGGEPTLEPEQVPTSRGSMPMVQVGIKGMYIGLVGFYFDNDIAKIKYERVPLDARFEDSEQMKQVFISYQNDLKRLWLSGNFADIQPRPHPTGHFFVGSEVCADCHGREYEIWEDGNSGNGGPHKHATASLTDPNERSWVQRHYDPECVSCHMTGWNPQGYFPYQSGYLNHLQDEHLYDNGCENCHGPGSAHVDAERNNKNDSALLQKLRAQVRVTLDEARQSACMQCHDLDNSPDFLKEGAFDKYWPEIEH